MESQDRGTTEASKQFLIARRAGLSNAYADKSPAFHRVLMPPNGRRFS